MHYIYILEDYLQGAIQQPHWEEGRWNISMILPQLFDGGSRMAAGLKRCADLKFRGINPGLSIKNVCMREFVSDWWVFGHGDAV
jgi:hypothetical protein